jgi:hypothetical protein
MYSDRNPRLQLPGNKVEWPGNLKIANKTITAAAIADAGHVLTGYTMKRAWDYFIEVFLERRNDRIPVEVTKTLMATSAWKVSWCRVRSVASTPLSQRPCIARPVVHSVHARANHASRLIASSLLGTSPRAKTQILAHSVAFQWNTTVGQLDVIESRNTWKFMRFFELFDAPSPIAYAL